MSRRAGLDVVTVSRRIGHRNPTVTLGVYAHLFGNTDERAAQVVETALAGILARAPGANGLGTPRWQSGGNRHLAASRVPPLYDRALLEILRQRQWDGGGDGIRTHDTDVNRITV